ncbi:lamin tail domain-containing protein [Paraflavitalea speifideaquila]|uniref:lamin tail domain-containing protein n=1 Tax=Paraflavitalea speifideaquila TaxID=3076558 RepID=UPI0028EA1E94|nr:lamin tail domain-containing protein [Paraflavitalea speifideiaquila]
MNLKLLVVWLLVPFTSLQSQTPQRFDIVITELFPDPTPPVALPNHEFVELKNVSGHTINLKGWKLSDRSATATIQANIEVRPDSFIIICSNSALPLFAIHGTAVGVSNFPSLNNEEDIITLSSPEGNTIHAVPYTDQWYRNSLKAGGGWTLEMIDPHNPCTGADNWKAAIDPLGGTLVKKIL